MMTMRWNEVDSDRASDNSDVGGPCNVDQEEDHFIKLAWAEVVPQPPEDMCVVERHTQRKDEWRGGGGARLTPPGSVFHRPTCTVTTALCISSVITTP